MSDFRWKQRFQNYDKAFTLLKSTFETRTLSDLSDLEQEGVIQRFKHSYELAWKTMKDYLEENGVVIDPLTPRNVIKEAFAAKIMPDGQVWINMSLHRNLLSQTYDTTKCKEVLEALVAHYLHAFEQLHTWFLERLATS